MPHIRLVYKLFFTVIASLFIIITVPLIKGLITIFSTDTAHRFVWTCHRCVGLYLSKLYGIRVRVMGENHISSEKGLTVVGNHVGYAELIGLTSLIPVVFVAKEEVKSWPLIGSVFKVGGEVFVDRESGGRSEEYAATVETALEKGINIFFAPEGTTSNGTILRKFKSPLFVPANRLKKKILPFAYFVEKIENKTVTVENRDKVLWHSDMPFTPHFMEFLKLKTISVVYHFGETIIPDYDDSQIEERRKFSAEVRQKIDILYKVINPFYSGNEE